MDYLPVRLQVEPEQREGLAKEAISAFGFALVFPPLVARVTGAVGKRIVTYWIKEIFFQSSMWVVAGHTRIGSRHYLLMGIDKDCGLFFMAFCAELSNW